jgi:xanthine dehydrogenase accessory factor
LELLSGHTQHVQAEVATPDSEGLAEAGEEGGHDHAGHNHGHEHGGHDHGDASADEIAAAKERQAQDSLAGIGIGPSDVTLDLARHLAGGQQVLLATAIRTDGAPPCQPGQKLLLGAGGPLSGTLGCSEFDVSAAADAAGVLATGRPVLRTYHHDLGSVEVYLEPYLHRPQLVVLAATPIALWLLRWGKDLGYETVLVESRSDWVTPEHRSAANRVLADAAEIGQSPAGEMEVVATDHDAPDVSQQVAALLDHKPRFVGIMGSARHTGGHLAALRTMGVPDDQVAQIQSPVGLNIGAKTPPEIALSILGGLMAARTGRPGGWIDNRTSR